MKSSPTKLGLLMLIALLVCGAWARPMSDPPNDPPGGTDSAETEAKRFVPVTVNGRKLSGPNSAAQRRDGRILIPVASVARSLGDSVAIDPIARTVSVRRQM